MSQKKSRKSVKKKRYGIFVWIVLLLAAAAVAVFAFYKIAAVLTEYRAGEEVYKKMEAYAAPEEDIPAEKPKEEPDAGQDSGPGIRVDFDSLWEINPDVVGWLYYPSLDISYPILKGEDNDYYLHHTIEKKKNFSGSIFMEMKNSSSFSDSHTIIYGHNMRNGSMFGKLKRIRDLEMTEEARRFWVITPEKEQLCRVFSAQEVKTGGEAYSLFSGPCQEFLDWIGQMCRTSILEPEDVTFVETDRVITLSTCTGNDKTRFIVQGLCQ